MAMSERRVWIAGGLAVLAVLVIGRIDLRHTESQVPPFPLQGQSTLPRYEEIKRLDEDFDRRAWLYGGVAAVTMGIATAVALACSPTLEGQRRVFSEAGVAGVVLGLVGVVLLWRLRSNIEPPRGAVAALVATAGTVVLAYAYAAQQDGSCDTPSSDTAWTSFLTWAALVTAITAVVLGLTGLAARRWFVALISLVVNPGALLYMALSSGAL